MTGGPRLALDPGAANTKAVLATAADESPSLLGFGPQRNSAVGPSLLYLARGSDLLLPEAIERELPSLVDRDPATVVEAIGGVLEHDPGLAAWDEALAAGSTDPDGLVADPLGYLSRPRVRRPGREASSLVAVAFLLRRLKRLAGAAAEGASLVFVVPGTFRIGQRQHLSAAAAVAGFTGVEILGAAAAIVRAVPVESDQSARLLVLDLGWRAARASLFEPVDDGWRSFPLPTPLAPVGTDALEIELLARAVAHDASFASLVAAAKLRTALAQGEAATFLRDIFDPMAIEVASAQLYLRPLGDALRELAGAIRSGGEVELKVAVTGGGAALSGVQAAISEALSAEVPDPAPLAGAAAASLMNNGRTLDTPTGRPRRETLEARARADDPWAKLALAEDWLKQVQSSDLDARAATLLAEAARAGVVPAMTRLATLRLEGRGVPYDPDAAARELEAAAGRGDAEAMALLGERLLSSAGQAATSTERPRAERLLRRAAEAGLPRADLALAKIGLQGVVGSARGDAVDRLRRAAQAGIPEAMRLYADELGPDDQAGRLTWLARAADAGDIAAMLRAAEVEASDDTMRRRWLLKAVGAGSAEASLRLAERRWWHPEARRHLAEARRLGNARVGRVEVVAHKVRAGRRLRWGSAAAGVAFVLIATGWCGSAIDGRWQAAAVGGIEQAPNADQARASARAYLDDPGVSGWITSTLGLRTHREELVGMAFRAYRDNALATAGRTVDQLLAASGPWPVALREGSSAVAALAEATGRLRPLLTRLDGSEDAELASRIADMNAVAALVTEAQNVARVRDSVRALSNALNGSAPTREAINPGASRLRAELDASLQRLDSARAAVRGDVLPRLSQLNSFRDDAVGARGELEDAVTTARTTLLCRAVDDSIAQGTLLDRIDELRAEFAKLPPERVCLGRETNLAMLGERVEDRFRFTMEQKRVEKLRTEVRRALERGDFYTARRNLSENADVAAAFSDLKGGFAAWVQDSFAEAELRWLAITPDTDAKLQEAQRRLAWFRDDPGSAGPAPFTYRRPVAVTTRIHDLRQEINDLTLQISEGLVASRLTFLRSAWDRSQGDSLEYWCSISNLIKISFSGFSMSSAWIGAKCVGDNSGSWWSGVEWGDIAVRVDPNINDIDVDVTRGYYKEEPLSSTMRWSPSRDDLIKLARGRMVQIEFDKYYIIRLQGANK